MDFRDLDTSLKITLENVNLYSCWLHTNRHKLLSISDRSAFIKGNIRSSAGNGGAIISFLKKTGLINGDLTTSDLATLYATGCLDYAEYCLIHLSKESLFKGDSPTANVLTVIAKYIVSEGVSTFLLSDIRSLDETLSPVIGDTTTNSRTDFIMTVLEGTGMFAHVGKMEDGKVEVKSEALPIISFIADNPLKNNTLKLNSTERFNYFAEADGGIFDIMGGSLPSGWADFFPHISRLRIPRSANPDKLQQIFFGAPGSGKSYKVNDITSGSLVIRTTFHPDSDYSSFVGAYKPVSDDADNGRISYRFVKQAFLKAYLKAWQSFVSPAVPAAKSKISFVVKGASYTIDSVGKSQLSQTKDLIVPKRSIKNVWDDLWPHGSFKIPKGPQPGRSIPQAISNFIKTECLEDTEGKNDFENGWEKMLEKLNSGPQVASVDPSSAKSKKYTVISTDSDEIVRVRVTANNSRARIEECYNDPELCNGVEEGIIDTLSGFDCNSFDEAWDELANRVNNTNNNINNDHPQSSNTEEEDIAPKPVYLVIEEINRGNCAQVFGDVFQLLDRQDNGFSAYPVESDSEIQKAIEYAFKNEIDFRLPGNISVDYAVLNYNSVFGSSLSEDIEKGRVLLLPPNLYILATMNTSDQSLFPMDSAFKRRWDWEYVPIDPDNTKSSSFTITIGDKIYQWSSFLKEVNQRIHNLSDSEDKQMGNFFIKKSIDVEEFKSKVMFYLWSEVCKEYEHAGSFFKNKRDNTEFTFNSLFPTNDVTNGILQGFMEYLFDK